MHDRNDPLVPAAESRRLVAASRDRVRVRHTELLAFDHITPSEGGILTVLGQAAQLYPHMYEIIPYRPLMGPGGGRTWFQDNDFTQVARARPPLAQ